MSKTNEPAIFMDWLRMQTESARFKMEIEQKHDPNCIWAEFETLILALDDFFRHAKTIHIYVEEVK